MLSLALLIAGTGAASAEACRRSKADIRANRPCLPHQRLAPYEPDRVKAGRQPGSLDLGNGTEVRVGGRVRAEYDMRR